MLACVGIRKPVADHIRQHESNMQAKHIVDVTLLDNYDKLQTSVQLIRKELEL